MHTYLRAVGFSKIKTKDQLQVIIAKTIKDGSKRMFVTYNDEELLAEYSMEFAEGMGLTVCGEMDEQDRFLYDYSIPFFTPSRVSSKESITIEKHMDKLSFAGVCDDSRVGITIIFYLQNRIDYIKSGCIENKRKNPSLSLSGLSVEGMVMMPIEKTWFSVKNADVKNKKRETLIEAAKKGDENAIETLTLDDMDMYSNISRKIKNNDLYTIVETYFMPYGVECDLYSVMGTIEALELVTNSFTGEEVYKMSLVCNEIPIDVCINKADLFGEPEVGRRFKGTVWLQGVVDFGEKM